MCLAGINSIYVLFYRIIAFALSSSPKFFYQYICVIFIYIYYYTEWLRSRRVHRPKFFTSIFLLLYRVFELALRSSPNFFLIVYMYCFTESLLSRRVLRPNFFTSIYLLFSNKIMFLLSKVVRTNLFIQYCLTFSGNSHKCIYTVPRADKNTAH